MRDLKTCDYEWCIEEVDEYGDIIDNDFNPKLNGLDLSALDYAHIELCLLRKDFNFGATNGYAYVKNKTLPDEFCNGVPVPKRFHKELNESISRA